MDDRLAAPKASLSIWQAHSRLCRSHANAPAGQALGLQYYNYTIKMIQRSPPLLLICLEKSKWGERSHIEEWRDPPDPADTQRDPTQKNECPIQSHVEECGSPQNPVRSPTETHGSIPYRRMWVPPIRPLIEERGSHRDPVRPRRRTRTPPRPGTVPYRRDPVEF